ncbi:MAG: RecX family transcriptional regulator [Deltaproteobacteria bacterium]|nr:RecX family transcriptional regulator [Deltaproteobacteria bacterium]
MPGQKRGRLRRGAPDARLSAQADKTAPEMEMETETGASAALTMAMRFISYRPRSVKETAQKLTDSGFSGDAIEDTINRLKSAGCLDDERFARELAGSRIRNKNWGLKRVALDLRSKGISDEIIHAALSNIDASADAETAARALEKWTRKTGVKFPRDGVQPPEGAQPLEKKAFEKAFRHLAARGFSAHVIMGLLKRGGQED